MTFGAIQPDYGGFNSKFLGIQLRFHASHPDAFPEFLTILSEMEATDPADILARGNRALSGDDHGAFHTFALGTVLQHERRHFHDFLLSPIGNAVFRHRLLAVFHGLQGVQDLKKFGVVPVPLTRWVAMADDARLRQHNLWSAFVGDRSRAFKIEPDAAQMVEIARISYALIRGYLISERLPALQPLHLFEASAICVQIQAVHKIFGAQHAQRFIELVLSDLVPPAYSKVLSMMFDLWWEHDRAPDVRVISAVISWSILGKPCASDDDEYPTIRFLRLFKMLDDEGLPEEGTPLRPLFDRWNDLFGYPTLDETMRANCAANDAILEQLRQAKLPADKLLQFTEQRCIEGMAALQMANQHMVGQINRDFEGCFAPHLYIDNDKLLDAPIRIDFHHGGVDAEWLKAHGLEIWKGVTLDSGQSVALSAFFRPRSKFAVDTEIAFSVGAMLSGGDLILSDLGRDDPDYHAAQRGLLDRGIRPLEILPLG